MTRAEFDAMFTKSDGTWDAEKYGIHQKQQHNENIKRINKELDAFKAAYKYEDTEGYTFVYEGISSGYPVYRGIGGSKHIFQNDGYKVIQQHAE